MSFSISVERLIERWQRDGLIDAETASKLNADLEKRAAVFSLGSVLATLGELLLGAAVIMLVAANWQEMPRLMRIGLIFVLIWVSYLGGAWRQSRGDKLFPAALYVVGCIVWGRAGARGANVSFVWRSPFRRNLLVCGRSGFSFSLARAGTGGVRGWCRLLLSLDLRI